MGHGVNSHPFFSFYAGNDRLGQRAVRPRVGAPASATRRVDGPGRTWRELFVDAASGARSARRYRVRLAASRRHGSAGVRHGCAAGVLLPELAAGNVQPFARAAPRWKHRDHAIYERTARATLPRMAARQQLRNAWFTRGTASFPLLLWSGRVFRKQFVAAQPILSIS